MSKRSFCFYTFCCKLVMVMCMLPAAVHWASNCEIPPQVTSHVCAVPGDACSAHQLTCGQGERLAILGAHNGFQSQPTPQQCNKSLSCPSSDCCSYNASSDCRDSFEADDLDRVRNACSFNQSCSVRVGPSAATTCWGTTKPYGANSSFSMLEAICLSDTVIQDPCTDSTVTGYVTSLYLRPTPTSQACRCRIDTSASGAATTRQDTTFVYTYDIEFIANHRWAVDVRESDEGALLWSLAGGVDSDFPARMVASTVATPLSVQINFLEDAATFSGRVWLGFHSRWSQLTVRCGKHLATVEESLGKATTVSGHNDFHSRSSTVVSEPSATSTVNIIIYVAICLGVLVFLGFLRGFFKTIKRKGCPSFCPAVCRCYDVGMKKWRCPMCDKQETPDSNKHRHPQQSQSQSHQQQNASVPNNSNINGFAKEMQETAANRIQAQSDSLGADSGDRHHTSLSIDRDVVGLGSGRNKRIGQVPADNQDEKRAVNIHIPHDLVLRRKRSLASLRSRASLSNLEDITESDEEGHSPNPHNRSFRNIRDKERLFTAVPSKLYPLEDEDDKSSDNKEGREGVNDVKSDEAHDEDDDAVFTTHDSSPPTPLSTVTTAVADIASDADRSGNRDHGESGSEQAALTLTLRATHSSRAPGEESSNSSTRSSSTSLTSDHLGPVFALGGKRLVSPEAGHVMTGSPVHFRLGSSGSELDDNEL